jgi:hypothetical protein
VIGAMTGLWVQSTHYHAERKTKPSIPGSSMLSKTFVFGDSVLIPGATGARVAGSPSRRARPPVYKPCARRWRG